MGWTIDWSYVNNKDKSQYEVKLFIVSMYQERVNKMQRISDMWRIEEKGQYLYEVSGW